MKIFKISCFVLLACLSLFYLFSTLYIAFNLHLYLPAADLIGRHSILSDAYKHGIGLEIFSLHNTFHWIVFPKIILSLDMMLTQGSGWIIKSTAIIFFMLTIIILILSINKTPNISTYQKLLLSLLAVSLMGGSWNRESLNSPISQYSMICFFLVLLAYLVAFSRDSAFKKIGIGSSMLLLLMSSGQAVALFPALVIARFKQYLPQITKAVLAMLICYALLEICLIALFESTPVLLRVLSLPSEDKEQLDQVLAYFWTNPIDIFLGLWSSVSYFMAKFTFPQIYNLLSENYLKSLAAIFYLSILLIFIRHKTNWQGDKFWLICFLFCFITGLLPAFIRMSDGYGNRFANLGSLMQLSAMMMLVLFRQGKYTSWVIAGFASYILLVLPHTYRILEKENHSLLGASAIKPQLAYSIGLRDPDLIVSAPGAWWRETDSQGIYELYPFWKENSLGVFSSQSYKIFSGEIDLPKEEKYCEYKFTHVFWRIWQQENEVAVYVTGTANAADDYVNEVVFYDDNTGKPIGRAIKDIAKPLHSLLFEPSSWDGFIKLDNYEERKLKAVAYGSEFKCQPWVVDIKP